MTIKISAFPAATLPMGSGDLVTGLQGGANANFSQAQLLSAQDGAAGGAITIKSGNALSPGPGNGGSLDIYSGNGYGASGNGGSLRIQSGYGGASGNPGNLTIELGNGAYCYNTAPVDLNVVSAGYITLRAGYTKIGSVIYSGVSATLKGGTGGTGYQAGYAQIAGGNRAGTGNTGGQIRASGCTSNGTGGAALITGGFAVTGSNSLGGAITMIPGPGDGTGVGGNAVVDLTNGGNLVINNLPTSAAGLPSGAVWRNSGVLTIV